jgi:hypothetical protein
MKITYGSIESGREYIKQNLRIRRLSNPTYRVIDLGGVAGGGWTNEICDLVVDINSPLDDPKAIAVDICDPDSWLKLFDITKKDGLFDYAICTHTLEDIYNPILPLKFLPKIARAGIITMPSMRTELSRPESNDWLGYIHHRWIFDQEDGQMLLAPKLSFLESLVKNTVSYDPQRYEIRYEWQQGIPFKQFMNNYLGPNLNTVVENYRQLIAKV